MARPRLAPKYDEVDATIGEDAADAGPLPGIGIGIGMGIERRGAPPDTQRPVKSAGCASRRYETEGETARRLDAVGYGS